jgi:hypothetical protein
MSTAQAAGARRRTTHTSAHAEETSASIPPELLIATAEAALTLDAHTVAQTCIDLFNTAAAARPANQHLVRARLCEARLISRTVDGDAADADAVARGGAGVVVVNGIKNGNNVNSNSAGGEGAPSLNTHMTTRSRTRIPCGDGNGGGDMPADDGTGGGVGVGGARVGVLKGEKRLAVVAAAVDKCMQVGSRFCLSLY